MHCQMRSATTCSKEQASSIYFLSAIVPIVQNQMNQPHQAHIQGPAPPLLTPPSTAFTSSYIELQGTDTPMSSIAKFLGTVDKTTVVTTFSAKCKLDFEHSKDSKQLKHL